jgi:hypothetical protein
MPSPVYSIRVAARHWVGVLRLSIAIQVFGSLGCLFANCHAAADEVVTRVVTAWETHEKSIESFQYHCDFEWIQDVNFEAVAEESLFGSPPDKDAKLPDAKLPPVVSRSELMFCMDRGKFAAKLTGERWDIQKQMQVPNDWQACFDGVDAKWLLQAGSFPHGYIAVQGDLEKALLSSNTHMIGLWLGYSPSTWLRHKRFELEKMVVRSSEEVNDDGTPCIELMIPRAKSVGLLYVDPARGYRPLKLIQKFEETIQVEHAVSYRDDAAGGVSGWVSSYFDSGELSETYAGKTKTVSINEPLDEKLFKIQFPIGTQITEEKAGTRKYYVQEAEGHRKEISEDEYGKLPTRKLTHSNKSTRSMPLIITAVMTLAFFVAVVVKRKNSRHSNS